MARRGAHKLSATSGEHRMPEYEAQLATLVDAPPEGDNWLHELKYDGYRIGCSIDHGRVLLMSRRGKEWTGQFPEVCEAAGRLPVERAVLDGEVCVLLADGRTSFQALQNAFSGASRRDLVYFVFDLLYLDGRDLRALPIEERKKELEQLLHKIKGQTRMRYSSHVVGNGSKVLANACALGAEGIVSKRRDLAYRPGRNMGWLKSKCLKRQEFVIGGFTDPEGSRQGIGSLLIGYYDDQGKLVFAGKVGTGAGFTAKFCAELRQKLERIEDSACPFAQRPAGWLGQHAHWVRPKLVAEIAFVEWTEGGNIRHGSFQGFRADKRPEDVKRETETPVARAQASAKPAALEHKATQVGAIVLTHPERVIYPKLGFSKLDLARYYAEIAEWMLPYVGGRPLTVVRCAKPVDSENALRTHCKFLPHEPVWYRWAPKELKKIKIREQEKRGEYLIAESADALIALAQGDIVEIHCWNSTVANLEKPDRLVFDLDPAPDVSFERVIAAALELRRLFEKLELESWVKTTGGKGLHVVVPFVPELDWDSCYAVARMIATELVKKNPKLFTTTFGKSARNAKILVDYKRNHRAAVAVAAYSPRARPDGFVSAPIRWTELTPEGYTLSSVRKRLARLKRDPWDGFWRSRQSLASLVEK